MKSILQFALFIFLVQTINSCNYSRPHEQEYEDKLNVISNPRMYHEMIQAHPDSRLVDLEEIIPGIVLDIRYATKNNFTGKKIYKSPKAYLRLPVSKALQGVQEELNTMGLAIKVFDAYRPYSATVKFYEVYPDTNFVAAPWHGSRHNRGCAVDLTIIDLATGNELEMPTPFDDFSDKAHHDYMDLPPKAIENRTLLKEIMAKHGFSKYDYEWWHYDFIGWEKFDLMNIPFEEL
jgi:zinc D-Ala-D-Ala dipeptidase